MIGESVVTPSHLERLSDYSLQLNRWFLKPIGVWPSSSTTTKVEKIVSLILNVICYSAILTTVIPCILLILLEDEDIREKLKMVGPLSHWFIGGVNYTTLLLRSKEIRCCVEHMQTDWQTVTRLKVQQMMLKHARFGRYVAALCAAFMQGGVMCHCVVSAFTTQIVQIGNETRTIRMLPCPAYKKLVPVDTSPTNEIILAIQFMSGFVANSSAVSAFSLATVFAAHAYGQLNVLMMTITEFVDESRKRDKNVRLNEIGVIVKHHLRALSFISRIEDMMNEICFIELFKCTFNICMLCYYILMHWDDHDFGTMAMYMVILCSMTFNIFIVCYIGEKLTEQSRKVGDAVYMTKWYYLPGRNILDLMLIISRSSVVTKITAGKLFHMTLITFTSVMKTAFAYLNMLRQTT